MMPQSDIRLLGEYGVRSADCPSNTLTRSIRRAQTAAKTDHITY